MKVTKTMKYEISYDKQIYDLLSDIQYAIRQVKNRATTMAYDWTQYSFSYKERTGEYPKAKEVIGKSVTQDIYAIVKELAPFVASYITDSANQEAVKKFNEMKSDILRGNKTIPNYKQGGSFPIRAKQINHLTKETGKKYHVQLSLLSKPGALERNLPTNFPVVLRTGNGASEILDRIIDGSYKLCDSRISKRKNKFYIDMVYQHEVFAPIMDESRVLGVDLGIANAVYMAFNFDKYQREKIAGNETIAFRQRVEERRKSILRQGKYAGEGRRGHGRKTLLKPTDKLQDRITNFRRTTNHKYSKFIVETAVKYGCGTIQMEDLGGLDKREGFLRNWDYFELQQFVEYKAAELGIKFVKVAPKYTSQRCNACGHIEKENRKTQASFKCTACDYEAHADFNAAKNIAEPRIEELIQTELKKQAETQKV